MIGRITGAALRLDEWLQDRLGRPYHLLLAAGLTVEIVRRLIEIPQRAAHLHRLVPVLLLIVLEAALLIHQVGALSHHVRRPAPAPAPVDPAQDE
jgi:xanthosine utilization system XapX-like protein